MAQRKLIRWALDNPRLAWEIGCIAALRSEDSEAMAWLRRAYDSGWRWTTFAERDPLLDNLREQSTFRELLRQMRSDVEAMRLNARQQAARRAEDATPGS